MQSGFLRLVAGNFASFGIFRVLNLLLWGAREGSRVDLMDCSTNRARSASPRSAEGRQQDDQGEEGEVRMIAPWEGDCYQTCSLICRRSERSTGPLETYASRRFHSMLLRAEISRQCTSALWRKGRNPQLGSKFSHGGCAVTSCTPSRAAGRPVQSS